MNGFKRKSHQHKSQSLGATGVLQVDVALERHKQIVDSAKAISEHVKSLLVKVKDVSEKSSLVSQSFQNFYSGSVVDERLRLVGEAHEKADREIPNKLLEVANEHIITRLDAYMKSLNEVQAEITIFSSRQSDFSHYEKKVEKLEEEKRKREGEGKSEKAKNIEKLTRNHKKLNDAKKARDEMVESLLKKLQHIYDTRYTTMDPIFKFTFLFQQEYFKQCSDAFNFTLPASPDTLTNQVNTTAPVTPPHVSTGGSSVYQYDSNGNRISSPSKSPTNAPPSPPPPSVPVQTPYDSVSSSTRPRPRPPAPAPLPRPNSGLNVTVPSTQQQFSPASRSPFSPGEEDSEYAV